jgi:hypothetical protein
LEELDVTEGNGSKWFRIISSGGRALMNLLHIPLRATPAVG